MDAAWRARVKQTELNHFLQIKDSISDFFSIFKNMEILENSFMWHILA